MLTGFTLCFGHVNAIFQSFFHKFLLGLCRICLCAKVCIMNLVFVICLLLPWLGIDCVTDNINWKLHFLEWITHSFVLKFCPQNTENCIFGLKISNILGQNAPRSLPPSIGKQGGGIQSLIQSVTPGLSESVDVDGWVVSGQSRDILSEKCHPFWQPAVLYSNLLATSIFIETPVLSSG